MDVPRIRFPVRFLSMLEQRRNAVKITHDLFISESEIRLQAVRSRGPGGQNVNKVSSAVQLFFDITSSSLPEVYKQRLLRLNDRRVTSNGVVIIKSSRSRSQEKNREDALNRLRELIISVTRERKKRRPTIPTSSARQKRLDSKARKSSVKKMRKAVEPDQTEV